jgi:hypothetical protein
MNRFLLGIGMLMLTCGLAILIVTGFDRLALHLGATVHNLNIARTEFLFIGAQVSMMVGSIFIALAFPKKF